MLESFPPEILFKVLLYLDIPDLSALSSLSPYLRCLAEDNVLHRTRLLVVAPSRISHCLFANGGNLRPNITDLVNRGVMRGLHLERRWRTGAYIYSAQSVRQYEISRRLLQARVRDLLGSHLTARKELHTSNLQLDPEYFVPSMSRSLLATVHKLKWCFQRDKLSRSVKATHSQPIAQWISGDGVRVLGDGERTRLAVCPGTRKLVRFFEGLAADQ